MIFEVGQKVFTVQFRGFMYPDYLKEYRIITKLGREFAYFEDGSKFDIGDLGFYNKHGFMLGRVYKSEEAYEEYEKRRVQWKELKAYISLFNSPPPNLHGEDMSKIIDILKKAE